MEDVDSLVPLSVAARIAGTTYWLAWRAVTSGDCTAARRGHRWYCKAADLCEAVKPQPVPVCSRPAA